MSFRNQHGIYHVLRTHLEAAKHPLTCVELFDFDDVKQYAPDSNRVSDYLGHLFRRGLVSRYPVPRTETSAARYGYLWKSAKAPSPQQRTPQPRLSIVANGGVVEPLRSNMKVIEQADGSVTIELSNLLITVKPK